MKLPDPTALQRLNFMLENLHNASEEIPRDVAYINDLMAQATNHVREANRVMRLLNKRYQEMSGGPEKLN